MCEELNPNEATLKLMKLIEERNKSTNELKGRSDGVGTVIKFLLERMKTIS